MTGGRCSPLLVAVLLGRGASASSPAGHQPLRSRAKAHATAQPIGAALEPKAIEILKAAQRPPGGGPRHEFSRR